MIVWPNRAIRMNKSIRFRGWDLVVVIDGCEQRVKIPSDKLNERSLYSGKKRTHTFTVMLACAPDGTIYFLSCSYNGSKNDMNIYEMSENQIHRGMMSDEAIVADKGYVGVAQYHPKIVLPILGEEKSLTNEEIAYNNEQKKHRIVVENVFAHIKKYNICSHVFRSPVSNVEISRKKHNEIWVICAGMVNEFVMPIRNNK